MKFGPRKPNFKSRFKARTSGKLKRQVKRSINPTYGKKGMGWINNPKKAAYNKVYNKTTFRTLPKTNKKKRNRKESVGNYDLNQEKPQSHNKHMLNSPDIFYEIKEKTVYKNKISYWWIMLSLLLANLGVGVVLVVAFLIMFFIYRKNKNAIEEKVEYRAYLPDKMKHDLLSQIQQIMNKTQSIAKKLSSTTNVDTFFQSLSEFNKNITNMTELIDKYDIPVSLEIGKSEDGEETYFNLNQFEKIKNETIEEFLIRFFDQSYDNALKLKTQKGRQARMERNREKLMEYQSYLTPSNLEFIDKLWADI